MNQLEQFIATINTRSYGFLRDTDIPKLIALDRLFQVLVRCGGCRFACSAQDVEHIKACIVAGGDYVRDVSFPVGSIEKAVSWQPERPISPMVNLGKCLHAAHAATDKWCQEWNAAHLDPADDHRTTDERESLIAKYRAEFNENDCGGAFDGHQVTSDADPGL